MRGNKAGLEREKLENLTENQQPLSGAYIRSLVKQLTSSRTKDRDDLPGDGFNEQELPPPPPPPRRKKQARRRLHTTRPYQERLLNMAEARREIVTALKFHRATMKQQKQDQERSRTERQPLQTLQQPPLEQNSRNCGSSFAPGDFLPPVVVPPFVFHPLHSYSCPNPLIHENLNIPLPNQPLGLNLNFQDFDNFSCQNPSIYLPSSSSSSSSSSCPYISVPNQTVGLHPTLDDEEISEIRSIGEKHQMEWNDSLNLATSALWFKFLNTMEIGAVEEKNGGCYPFDEAMEFPAWLNSNESCLDQQHLNENYSDDCFHNLDLPCIGVEEIGGKEMEWLAGEV